MQNTGAVLQKVAEMHLCTLCRAWGAPERGRGHEARATSAILMESDMTNTGDFVREVKTSGQEARETPTKPRYRRKWRMGRRSRRTGCDTKPHE